MNKVYLIKPLEKKSIVYHVEMFRENADGSISWFNLDETECWVWGPLEVEDEEGNVRIICADKDGNAVVFNDEEDEE